MSKRFLIKSEALKGSRAVLEGSEAHHLLRVMRLKQGEPVVLFDGKGTLYEGVIERTSQEKVWISIQSLTKGSPSPLKILLLCAVPRHGKMDTIVEKLTELGVDGIGAVLTERTVPRWDASQKKARLSRWERIGREASKQSGGNRLPRILGVLSFQEAVELRENPSLGVLLSPRAESSLTEILPTPLTGELFLLVGPEGGWSEREEAMATDAGWRPATLWDRTLKVDTACIAAVSIVQSKVACLGRLGASAPFAPKSATRRPDATP